MVEGLPSQYIFQLLPKMSAFTQSAEKVNLIKSLCGTLVDHPFRIFPFLFQTQSIVGDSHVTDEGPLHRPLFAEFVARNGTEKCVFVPPKDQLESAAKLKFEKNEEWTQADYENIAKQVLLSAEDARIWVEHVGLTSGRRKAGAKKATETRARKRQDRQGKVTYQEPVAAAVL